jgi:uncharacterized tellurite resistance protein B-like protein
MAHADGEFHIEENKVILEKMNKLYPPGSTDLREKLSTTVNQYKNVDAAAIPKLISQTFKHFDKVKFTQKYKIYADMYDIINADGKVDESETAAMETLKEIIEMGNEH